MDEHEAHSASDLPEQTVAAEGQAAPVPPEASADAHAEPVSGGSVPANQAVTSTPDADAPNIVPVASATAAATASDSAAVRVGPYELGRKIAQSDGRTFYVARAASPNSAANDGQSSATGAASTLVIETPERDTAALERVIASQLRHPRLLAPESVRHDSGKVYVTLAIPGDLDVEQFTSLAEAGALDEVEALKAAAGLADALAFLHRNGVVVHEIGQGTLFAQRGRAYLAALETATDISGGETEDVNQLARAFAAFSSGDNDTNSQAPGSQMAEIVERGSKQEFATAEDLQNACAVAAQFAMHSTLAADEADATTRLIFHAASATSIGRLRSQNQDAAAITVLDVLDDVGHDMPVGIFVLADGMGGEARGELASRLGARVVTMEMMSYFLLPAMAARTQDLLNPEATAAADQYDMAQTLANAAASANQHVRALASELGEATGSTLTAVAARGTRAVLAHLGDSRAYLLHGDTMVRLSEDHTLLARLEAMDHPLLHDPAFSVPRNFLYRSLGQEDEAPADLYEFRLQPGDRLMLCSDGLWDEVDERSIAQVLAMSREPDACARALVRLANEGGGHDNSTALVVFVEEAPPDSASDMARINLADLEYDDADTNEDEDDASDEPDTVDTSEGEEQADGE